LWKEVDGTRTYFLYSDEGLVGEYDASGNELRTYGYMPGSTWTTDVLFQKSNGVYYWYRNDQLGTPQKITTTTGAVVWTAIYDSFGNLQETTTTGFTNNLRMAGQYFDEETGLYYNLNRYYDPTTGRYLRTDPYGDGINLYAYVYNNPQGMIDPMGLCATRKFFTLQGQANFWAGFGDALTFGGTRWIRKKLGSDDVVNKSSGLYIAGEITTFALGVARIGYAATAKALPLLIKGGATPLKRALTISAARNTMKKLFRLNPFSKYRIKSAKEVIKQYKGNPKAIIEAATRTNPKVNRLGALAAAGATTNIATTWQE
jgi:RHS repeat-associated protein